MKLYIDTSNREKIVIAVSTDTSSSEDVIKLDDEVFETSSLKEKSQKLLRFIEETLKSKGKNVKDVTEIEVNTGPGSFTGLRVGVSVANTLGWSLGIAVNGKNVRLGEQIEIKYK